jgi:hypothetical protein
LSSGKLEFSNDHPLHARDLPQSGRKFPGIFRLSDLTTDPQGLLAKFDLQLGIAGVRTLKLLGYGQGMVSSYGCKRTWGHQRDIPRRVGRGRRWRYRCAQHFATTGKSFCRTADNDRLVRIRSLGYAVEWERRNRRLPPPYPRNFPVTRRLFRPVFIRHSTQERIGALRDKTRIAHIPDPRYSPNGLLRPLGMGLRWNWTTNHGDPIHDADHQIDTAQLLDLIQRRQGGTGQHDVTKAVGGTTGRFGPGYQGQPQ